MNSTTHRIAASSPTRHVVAALLWLLFAAAPAVGQDADWRAYFAAGEEARGEGDHAGYARAMASAVEALPEGHLNRPFAQYHAARAYALGGDAARAGRYLQMAWDEEIEALMISFAAFDPAFDGVRDQEPYRRVMALADAMTLGVTPLSGPVHLVDGAGSKVVASVGSDGVLLVDTGYGAALSALRRALAGIGGGDVRRLVLTHPHEDHWGMVGALGAEAEVWAHPGTASAMAEPYTFIEGVVLEPKPELARPEVLVQGDTTFRFNGEDVTLFGVEAHTPADIAVHFQGSRVLHLGDAYLAGNPMMFPGGDDPDGFLTRLESRLRAMDEGTVVIGGHDEPVGVGDVLAQIDETRACMALVRRALAEGHTVEEAAAEAEGRFAPQWVAYFFRALGDGGTP